MINYFIVNFSLLMKRRHNFKTNRDIKNEPFFFEEGKKQSHCYVWFKIVFTLLFFFFSSSKNIQAQCTLSCNGQTTISLDATGNYIVTTSTILNNPLCNPNDFSIEITDASGNIINNPISCTYLGQTLNAKLINNNDGNSCWGTISVSDNLAPTIQCQDLFIFCYENAHPEEIGYPIATDNCTNITPTNFTYTDTFTDLPCYSLQNGQEITAQIERIWTVTDNQGNTTNCTQNIFYKRVTTTDIVFPSNKDDFETPALDCKDDPTDLSLTGEPMINGVAISSDGLCELAVSYTDQVFNICGTGSYKIIRTWTGVDWCSSEFILDAQVINVLDKTAPIITCPNDLTVGTNSTTCSGEVMIPQATATDDCSEVTITANWEFGNGFGPFSNVPVGSYSVTYTAEDACGNTSNCTIEVTVEDTTSPVAICESHIAIGLLTDGFTTIYASSVDAGSYDNCGLGQIVISRDGINFSDSILLNCTDALEGTLPVTLRIYDTNHNYNECTSTIQIQENITPTIICPIAVTIQCTEDVLDLNLTGEAAAIDNCSIDTLYFSDENNLNACGEGTVTRTWTAVDAFGNMTSCIQLIQIEDNTPLTIQFPAHIDLFGCSAATTTDITGEPTTNGDCESLGITFSDVVFDNTPDLCFKILRTWTVVSWCQYEPNNPNSGGYETYTQVIKIIDDGTSATISVAGVITNESGSVMSNVAVFANNVDTEEMVMCMDGVYELSELDSSQPITITPTRDGDDGNGVSTIDLVFIQRHILGLTPLNTPYKMIAADVNHSGSITTFDMVLLRQVILQNIDDFPTNTSWRFVDAEFVFTDSGNPFMDDFPETITIEPVGGETYNIDFVAIKIGDVNGNASPD